MSSSNPYLQRSHRNVCCSEARAAIIVDWFARKNKLSRERWVRDSCQVSSNYDEWSFQRINLPSRGGGGVRFTSLLQSCSWLTEKNCFTQLEISAVGHYCRKTGPKTPTSYIHVIEDLEYVLPVKFHQIPVSKCREVEKVSHIGQGGHICWRIAKKNTN